MTVVPGQGLPDLSWSGELACLTGAWPCLGPTWLAATEKAMPELRPWHTIATRARGELALMAGYVLTAPPAAGLEPRTYLGWQPSSGGGTWRGAEGTPAGASASSAEIDALGTEPFFPALLLGSPMGYRTEVAYNFWTRSLMAAIVSALVPAAFDAGMRCIIAPWLPDRRGNQDFVDALTAAGGYSTFWGYEDSVLAQDGQSSEAAGVSVERMDGPRIRPHIPRIAELACQNGHDSGAGETPERIAGMLSALLDAGADLRAYLGRKGNVPVASCVTICKNHRLFVTWPGFDYAAMGEGSHANDALLLDAPVRDAYAEGLRTVEFGPGAHRASVQRGWVPRAVTTVLIMADPRLRQQAATWLDAFGRSRRAASGDAASVPSMQVMKPSGRI